MGETQEAVVPDEPQGRGMFKVLRGGLTGLGVSAAAVFAAMLALPPETDAVPASSPDLVTIPEGVAVDQPDDEQEVAEPVAQDLESPTDPTPEPAPEIAALPEPEAPLQVAPPEEPEPEAPGQDRAVTGVASGTAPSDIADIAQDAVPTDPDVIEQVDLPPIDNLPTQQDTDLREATAEIPVAEAPVVGESIPDPQDESPADTAAETVDELQAGTEVPGSVEEIEDQTPPAQEADAPETSEPQTPPEPVIADTPEEPEPETTDIAAIAPDEPQTVPSGPAWEINAVPYPFDDDLPMISIILETSERNAVPVDTIIELGLPLNLAIVPNDLDVSELGAQARSAGLEVVAHIPMEPRGTADPGPEAIRVDMTEDQILAQMNLLLARLPEAVAVSNFMGSKATEDADLMRIVVGNLDERGLGYIDSRTSPRSKGFQVAQEIGAVRARNSRFIPSDVTPDQAYTLLERAAAEARQRGGAVLIGPANRGMLLGVQQWALERNGKRARLAPVSAIFRTGGGR